ncbi:MAG TPA: TetR/AcrR family transcriptional regulator [Aridibacter sp.]|nr:TetR/AcrR family transcriptional regulator [Aridibacter sp.]
MPWEKKFDIDDSLEKAKQIFWRKGYEATSMQDLLNEMGIGRGSFYGTFKSKHDIYLRVLRKYGEQNGESLFRIARQIESPRAAILYVFEQTIVSALQTDSQQGCFLANAALEVAPFDEDAGRIVEDSFAEIRRFFRMLVSEAQARGEIDRKKNPSELGSALLSLLLGLKVLARSAPQKEVLEASLKQADNLLG